ncbi:cache domain-containing protein [Roseateles koreensis]|uniref:Cache domain-containing protein n=1 Tax=Roseateles koreensis TaxID=2987526 RepID=A0ABT5KRJ3_9BURK|nr:cache domain-containing protein [Roseateles koreensis]MDC8785548.1 cache domain-containing protein [Roseateles koreensis]
MRLRTKIILLAVLPLVASLALLAVAVRMQESRLARREHDLVERAYMEARRTELRNYVALAISTVQPLYDQHGTEKYAGPDDELNRQHALKLLASLDYGPDGYFFVYDLKGNVLMHSRQPELLGRNLWELRDAQGRPTIQQLIARARAGGGYVDYSWRKPSSGQAAAKLGYVVALERWQWMVGTGLYLDDIQSTMAQLDRDASANIGITLLWIVGIAVFGVALISVTGMALNFSEYRLAETKLRRLAHQVVQSQEDERAHLARELHDGVSQTLVSTKLLVEAAIENPVRGAMLASLNKALSRLNGCLTEVRRISHRLRPALLDTLGLPAALQHLGHEFDEAGPTRAVVHTDGAPQDLPEVVKTVLFRVAQESLTNVAKHAGATQLVLNLGLLDDGTLCMAISDDGRGFDSTAMQVNPELGIGLRNMRERMASIDGTLQVTAVLGHGTLIEARLPAAVLARWTAGTTGMAK